jgi:hypothetical protein
MGESVRHTAHDTVRHLYVYDGDLKNQDAIASNMAGDAKAWAGPIAKMRSQLHSARSTAAFELVVTAGQRFATLTDQAIAAPAPSPWPRDVVAQARARRLVATQEVSASAQELAATAQELDALVRRFKLDA